MESDNEAILLKIKRDFTSNEAVQSLLKIVSGLEIEVGTLKSELHEAQHKLERIRKERTLTKKQWMEEEIVIEFSKEIIQLKKKNKELQKQANDWRDRYFNLLNKTPYDTSKSSS